MPKKLIKNCVWRHSDCFAYGVHGSCICLETTEFPWERDCPFYKSYEKNEQDRARAVRRLESIGRQDLIEKYELDKRKPLIAGMFG